MVTIWIMDHDGNIECYPAYILIVETRNSQVLNPQGTDFYTTEQRLPNLVICADHLFCKNSLRPTNSNKYI